jgi:protein involved in polysaccharide export with SLBB domain
MIRFKLITFGISSALLLLSCNEILEPVSLFAGKQDVKIDSLQENFEINIQSLTFESAQNANNSPYPRWLIQNGIGSKAKVLDEAELVTSNMPSSSENIDYLLGIGDLLEYTQLNEFVTPITKFPSQIIEVDYLLGVGDELTLIQLSEPSSGLSTIISNITATRDAENNGNAVKHPSSESVLKTSGLVGTDGNILLLGLGSIKAQNRSLNDIQTEVRNILIRNGLAPSFQLEITGFNSKKAFVSFPNPDKTFGNNLVPITNLPITLRELIINYGVQPSSQNSTIVTLTRNSIQYRIPLSKLFDNSSPRIIIQDKDEIEIEEFIKASKSTMLVVGSKGYILISGLGRFKAENRSLSDVQDDISRALMKQKLVPIFQLEVTDFKSKKFFLISKNLGSKVIALRSSGLNIRDAILNNTDQISYKSDELTLVELSRNGSSYKITLQELLSEATPKVFIKDGDILELKNFEYKMGKVFALGGAGNAQMVPIDPSKRETLADVLFAPKGALNNLLAKRSEVYLLRGQNPSVAYHLDAQSVSRILVAAQTELRPNDIVYIADRPIISFSRTLSEIFPLRILLRDIQNNNIP